MDKNIVVVVYDSVLNSVFEGQVINPLIRKLDSTQYNHAYVVSFEPSRISRVVLEQLNKKHPKLTVVMLRRWKFISSRLLWFHTRQLRTFLTGFTEYEILARGAIAGFIAAQALSKHCTHLTIQARGLLTEEYRYQHNTQQLFFSFLRTWRTRQYEQLERLVYSGSLCQSSYTIEAVSAAMEEYLIRSFGAKAGQIIRAQEDIPPIIPAQKIADWRTKTRAALMIKSESHVYCFSGAIKNWQHPTLIVEYFAKLYQQNNSNFLLVLTPDVTLFKTLLSKKLPAHAYHVLTIEHARIYEYLAGADSGLVFREPGIVSWVARPVKAMEYEAVGLSVVHNNTVDWLLQRYGVNRDFTN